MTEYLYSLNGKSIWVAGHTGMVGSAIMQKLRSRGCNILTATRGDLDLTRQADVEDWLGEKKPDAIVVAAARVGGIMANSTQPVAFLVENLQIQTNVFTAAHAVGVDRLLFLGSSCIYPRLARQPMAESALLTGLLEPTNQWYAIAKISGVMTTQAYRREHQRDYISCMPTNLFGPGDSFDLHESHVLTALMVKAHRAKIERSESFEVWGTGTPKREFLFVEDLAEACVFLLEHYSDDETINVGSGSDITIAALAKVVAKVIGFKGIITHDLNKPDGMPRKLLDSSKINALGWNARTSLEEGIAKTYSWYLDHVA